MQDPNAIPLPFLVRDMLKFEHNAVFDLQVITAADAVVAIEVAGLTREGPFRFTFNTAATSAQETRNLRVPDLPISVSVRATSTSDNVNTVAALVYLRINETRAMLLCQGHLGNLFGISYPNQPPATPLQQHGKSYYLQGTNPAAGATASQTIPSGEFWLLKAVDVTLVTDATAANRRVNLIIDFLASPSIVLPSAATQTASLTKRYTFADSLVSIDDTINNYIAQPLVHGLLLPPGTIITPGAANLQAGDNFGSASYIFEKFYSNFDV